MLYIQSIDMYEKLWENEFIFQIDEWNTNTTKYNKIDNITYSTLRIVLKNIKELKDNCSEKVKEKLAKYEIQIYCKI